jgi:predicted NAD-dependent protein-ADP-ribosyltransferase YbiA (DUF1768 family)
MKFTCALTPKQLENLFKHVSKNMETAMENNVPFNAVDYMQDLFNKMSEKTDVNKAAEFVQQVPALMMNIATATRAKDFDIKTAFDLNNQFKDPANGIENTLKFFRPVKTPEQLEKDIQDAKDKAFEVKEINDPEKLNELTEVRLKPFSVFGTTGQEFEERDPSGKTPFTKEIVDENKTRTYNTIRSISEKSNLNDDSVVPGVTDVVYQGRSIALKAMKLVDVPVDQLDKSTKSIIAKARSIDAQGTSRKEVIPVNNRMVLVISDTDGNPLYFDQEGNIVEDAKDGKQVFQFIRPVRFDGKRYRATGLYDTARTAGQSEAAEHQVMSPRQIAETDLLRSEMSQEDFEKQVIGMSFDEYVQSIDEQQQADLKKLYDFTDNFLKGSTSDLLPMTGINEGVDFLAGGKEQIFFETLRTSGLTKEQLNDIYNSLDHVVTQSQGGQEGAPVVTISGNQLAIDRPKMVDEVAKKIAEVLTSDLSNFDKNVYLSQFLSNEITLQYRSYYYKYDVASDTLDIRFRNSSATEMLDPIDNKSLTREQLQEKNSGIADKIVKALTKDSWRKGDTKKGEGKYVRLENQPNRINLNKKFLTSGIGFFDFVDGKLVKGNYINNVLSKVNPEIYIEPTSKYKVFNAYMRYALPSETSKTIKETKNAIDENRSFVRQKKDELVDELILSPELSKVVVVSRPISGNTITVNGEEKPVNPFGRFSITDSKGRELVADILKEIVYQKDLSIIEANMPSEGSNVTLKLENVSEDVTDVIVVYNADGKAIAKIRETDYDTKEKPRSYPVEQVSVKEQMKAKDKEILTPKDVATPEKGGIASQFNLDRKGDLDQTISRAQIRKATTWWANSPLNKFIELQHVANIVNSNAYAQFLSAGSTLLNDGQIAQILINKSTGGNMVDAYHEAWHGFSQLFLTKSQKEDLYNEVRDYTDAKGNQPYAEMDFFNIEEMLAEDFRTYAKNPKAKTGSPKRNTIFRKILNFLKKLFGKATKEDVTIDSYSIPTVKEMFDNLYMASEDPSLLNNYTPLVDNVMFNKLDRGVPQLKDPKEDAFNSQDSSLIVKSIDSIISEIIDEVYKDISSTTDNKSGVVNILSDAITTIIINGREVTTTNKDVLFGMVAERLQKRLDERKKELGSIAPVPFNSLTSLSGLGKNAVAVMRSTKGEDKYIFLKSQIDDFDKLNLSSKQNRRARGEVYQDINIIGDFYKHDKITYPNKSKAGIIVVDTIDDAITQYNAYIANEENKQYTELVINKDTAPTIELSDEQAKLQDDIRILQTAIKNIGHTKDGTINRKKGLIKYYLENSAFDITKQKYVEVDNELDDAMAQNDPLNSEKVGEQKVNEKKLTELADKETLYILKSLFKVVKKGNKETHVYNRLGFKELSDFGTVWNKVVRAIGGIESPREMYQKLMDPKFQESFPEIKQLVKYKFPNPEQASKSAEFDINTSFWQTFKRKRTIYLQLTAFKGTDGYALSVDSASYETGKLVRSFSNNFRLSTPMTNKFTEKVDNKTELNLKKVVDEFHNKGNVSFNTSKSIQFARALGIPLEDIGVVKRTLKDEPVKYGMPFIYEAIRKMQVMEENIHATLAKGENLTSIQELQKTAISQFKQDPIGTITRFEGIDERIFGKAFRQKKVVENIALLHGRYSSEYANFSVLNASKNRVQEFIEDSTGSRTIYGINQLENLHDAWTDPTRKHLSYLDPKINSFTEVSQLLQNVFDFTDGSMSKIQGKSIRYFFASGTQNAENGTGTDTTSLDINGKFLQEMNTMLLGGVQEFLRAASKSSSFGVRLEGGNASQPGKKDKHLYVDIESFIKDSVRNGEGFAIDNIILPYISSEFKRLARFRQNRNFFKNYTGYKTVVDTQGNMAGEVFTAFDDVLSPEQKKALYEKADKGEQDLNVILANDLTLKNSIKERVKEYFQVQADNALDLLNVNEFIDPNLKTKLEVFDLSNEDLKRTLSKAYAYNSWIHHFETVGLLYGDLAQYNHIKEELHKRNSGLTSNGLGFRSDVDAIRFINDTWHKKSYETQKFNRPAFDFNGRLNTAIVKDVERESIYAPQIKKAWEKDYAERFKDVSIDNLRNQFTKKELSELGETITAAKLRKALIDKIVKIELDEYLKMNEADGQGLVTFDAYRTLKKSANQWTSVQEDLFQEIAKGRKVSGKEISEFFPVYKLHYYGPLADTQLPMTAMHKFSLMPLIPSSIEGSDMQELHEQMMDKGIQYVTFESGSKVASVTKDGSADTIYSDSKQKAIISRNEDGTGGIEFTPNTIYLEYLKDVTAVPSKNKGKTVFATQLRKIILENLYKQGLVKNSKHTQALKRYEDAVDNYTEMLTESILNEVGFELNDGRYSGNLSKFLTVVEKELGRKNVPEHLIKWIGVTQSNELKLDLSLHLEADTIEKLIIGIFEKRLLNQKVKGEALVQVSSSLTNGLWDTELEKGSKADELKYMGTNNLPFYHEGKDETNLMKVAIALQGDFFNLLNLEHIDGQKIETIERLNKMIKDDKWLDTDQNRKSVTVTGVRIPVSTIGFIEAAEVYEFLDPAAGNIIILPSEIVVKNGSDYDVDKMTMFFPSLDADGKFINLDHTNADIKNEIKELPQDIAYRADQIIARQLKALENELIQSVAGIIKLKENFASLTKPTGTFILKGIADDLSNYVSEYDRFKVVNGDVRQHPKDKDQKVISPTRTLEIGYNLHKHDVNLTGKVVLGIAANENALHPLLTSIGAKMPATYKAQVLDNNSKKNIDGDVSYDMRLKLRHNTMTNKNGEEVISLSDTDTADGINRIADLFAQSMNGLVDVEKDAWVFYIQANPEVAQTLFYLFKAGVPVKEAIYFVSNPLVREYAANQRKMKSAFAEIAGEKVDTSLIKYLASKEVLEKVLAEEERADYMEQVNQLKLKDVVSSLKGNSDVIYLDGTTTKNENLSKKEIEKLVLAKNSILNIFKSSGIEVFSNNKAEIGIASTKNYYYGTTVTMNNNDNVDKNGNFTQEGLYELIKNGVNSINKNLAVASFMHFIEIEKQIKGFVELKRLAKPEANNSKTIQEIVEKEQRMEDLSKSSLIDPTVLESLKKESVVGSFYKSQLIIDMMAPLFSLRNNKKITKFLLDAVNTSGVKTAYEKYGEESKAQFFREYKNAVVNYIYQNNMSNFIDKNGNVVNYPEKYRGYSIKTTTENIKNGVLVDSKGKTITINPGMISNDYNQKLYLNETQDPNSYESKGLNSFRAADDPFVTTTYDKETKQTITRYDKESSFFKYVIERELLRSQNTPESLVNNREFKNLKGSYESFLNKRALINSYNRKFLMEMEEYSYSQTVLDLITDFPSLKIKYPVLDKLVMAESMTGDKVLTLADKDDVEGDLATTYYHNLKELANPDIRKVQNAEDNAWISGIFKMFPLVSIYQHGVGYSLNGINAALPFDAFTSIIKDASTTFIDNQLNESVLNTIKDRLLDSSKRYKDYVVSKTLNNANIKADKEGTMSFAYLNNGRSDISSKTTFEAILNGERTSTSQWSDNKGYSYWTDTKVGDTIKFWSDNTVGSGQSVLVKVTGVNKIDMSKMTDVELEAWSKAEGWSFEQAKGRSRMNTKNKGIQIRYELLDPTSGNSIAGQIEEEISVPKQSTDSLSEPTQPSTSVKKGVSELFESNPELANAVYEALGFNQESDLPTSKETINIYAGSNQNTELSNFAIRPFTTNVETLSGEKQYTFQSVEQGFHFYKALVANNPQVAKQILATTNGGQLKRLTNRSNLKMTAEQVKEWDSTSKSIMLNLMYDSYAQNPQAAEKLLATGDAKITHTQDNTRWKKDFPEVVMTVRDMLKEEGFSTQPQITPQQKQQAQQQYSQYLDSVFPDSKVKDIVYRGGEKEDAKSFQYFTKNPAEAYMYAKAHVTKGGNITERNPIRVIKNNIAKKYNLNESVIWAVTDNELGIDGLEYEGLISKEDADKARKLIATNKDIKNLYRLIKLYDIVKIESESDLMKQYDDTEYLKYKSEYDKIRKELEPFFNREEVGEIKTAIINIVNPYKEEIVQEDLQNDRDAYKNGHDGAFLMDGDHFLVKKNTNQTLELGGEQDIEKFKKFVKGGDSTQYAPEGLPPIDRTSKGCNG